MKCIAAVTTDGEKILLDLADQPCFHIVRNDSGTAWSKRVHPMRVAVRHALLCKPKEATS